MVTVTFTATVSDPVATGNVTLWLNSSPFETASLSKGKVTFGISAGVGSYTAQAVYQGDTNFSGSGSSTITEVINKADSTTTLTLNSNPAAVGSSASFTVRVSVVAPASPSQFPTSASIDFGDGTNAAVPLTFGSGSTNHTYSSIGTFSVSANYAGSSGINPSTSAVSVQTVGKISQTISFTSSVPTATVGGTPYTPSATASSGPAVSFAASGACSVTGGAVHFSSAGTCTVTADQTGNATYNAAPQAAQQFTVSKGSVSASVDASVSPSVFGQSVTFTALISAGDGLNASGTVTFKDASATIGSGSLSAGQATLDVSSLVVGSHTITAEYSGDARFEAKTSGMTHTVNKGASTLTASAAPPGLQAGQAVTLTATVAVTPPAAGTPAGSVTFKDGPTTLGQGTVSSGQASLITSALTIGSHTVSAQYDGDDSFESSSNTVPVAVSAAIGAESQANTTTGGAQTSPSVAAIKGGFVAVWASNAQDGSGYGIYGRRFKSNGTAASTEFKVNATTKGAQSAPQVAGLSSGFVVVWQSDKQDKSGAGIYAQLYNAKGAPLGSEFKVNTTTAGNQTQPAVTGLADGGFVVAWTCDGQDKSGRGIYGQRYDKKGKAAGAEFPINTAATGDQSSPSAAGLGGGGFVVAWQGPDANGLGVYAQLFTAAGAKSGKEIKVNKVTANDQSLPSVAATSDGGFVITWQSALQDTSGLGVYAQLYTAAGKTVSGNRLINTTRTGDQGAPSAAFTDGGYAIVWSSNGQDGSGQGIYAQTFGPAGVPVNVEFRVNTTTAGDQVQPKAAGFAGGNFVVLWSGPDAGLTGIFQQRLQVPQPGG
jgi:hypothetical protein